MSNAAPLRHCLPGLTSSRQAAEQEQCTTKTIGGGETADNFFVLSAALLCHLTSLAVPFACYSQAEARNVAWLAVVRFTPWVHTKETQQLFMLQCVRGLGWDLYGSSTGRRWLTAKLVARLHGADWLEKEREQVTRRKQLGMPPSAILFFSAFSERCTQTCTPIYTYAWSKRLGSIMQSSERGWYLVWDKLLLQTKLPLSSLLKSLLVLFGLILWGMISNLGRRRRWWEGVGRGAENELRVLPTAHYLLPGNTTQQRPYEIWTYSSKLIW